MSKQMVNSTKIFKFKKDGQGKDFLYYGSLLKAFFEQRTENFESLEEPENINLKYRRMYIKGKKELYLSSLLLDVAIHYIDNVTEFDTFGMKRNLYRINKSLYESRRVFYYRSSVVRFCKINHKDIQHALELDIKKMHERCDRLNTTVLDEYIKLAGLKNLLLELENNGTTLEKFVMGVILEHQFTQPDDESSDEFFEKLRKDMFDRIDQYIIEHNIEIDHSYATDYRLILDKRKELFKQEKEAEHKKQIEFLRDQCAQHAYDYGNKLRDDIETGVLQKFPSNEQTFARFLESFPSGEHMHVLISCSSGSKGMTLKFVNFIEPDNFDRRVTLKNVIVYSDEYMKKHLEHIKQVYEEKYSTKNYPAVLVSIPIYKPGIEKELMSSIYEDVVRRKEQSVEAAIEKNNDFFKNSIKWVQALYNHDSTEYVPDFQKCPFTLIENHNLVNFYVGLRKVRSGLNTNDPYVVVKFDLWNRQIAFLSVEEDESGIPIYVSKYDIIDSKRWRKWTASPRSITFFNDFEHADMHAKNCNDHQMKYRVELIGFRYYFQAVRLTSTKSNIPSNFALNIKDNQKFIESAKLKLEGLFDTIDYFYSQKDRLFTSNIISDVSDRTDFLKMCRDFHYLPTLYECDFITGSALHVRFPEQMEEKYGKIETFADSLGITKKHLLFLTLLLGFHYTSYQIIPSDMNDADIPSSMKFMVVRVFDNKTNIKRIPQAASLRPVIQLAYITNNITNKHVRYFRFNRDVRYTIYDNYESAKEAFKFADEQEALVKYGYETNSIRNVFLIGFKEREEESK